MNWSILEPFTIKYRIAYDGHGILYLHIVYLGSVRSKSTLKSCTLDANKNTSFLESQSINGLLLVSSVISIILYDC